MIVFEAFNIKIEQSLPKDQESDSQWRSRLKSSIQVKSFETRATKVKCQRKFIGLNISTQL